MRPLRSFLLVSVLAASYSCEGDGVPLEQLDEETARALCANVFRCCDALEQASLFGGMTVDQAGCEAMQAAQLDRGLAAQRALVAAGKATYFADRVGDCLAALDGACGVIGGGPVVACERLFQGTGDDDAECTDNDECRSGNCDALICKPRVGLGEPCASDQSCQRGSFCDAEGLCASPKADGAACVDDAECQSGSCNTTAGSSGTCGKPMMCDGR